MLNAKESQRHSEKNNGNSRGQTKPIFLLRNSLTVAGIPKEIPTKNQTEGEERLRYQTYQLLAFLLKQQREGLSPNNYQEGREGKRNFQKRPWYSIVADEKCADSDRNKSWEDGELRWQDAWRNWEAMCFQKKRPNLVHRSCGDVKWVLAYVYKQRVEKRCIEGIGLMTISRSLILI